MRSLATLYLAAGIALSALSAHGEIVFHSNMLKVKEGRDIEAFMGLIRAEAAWPLAYYTRESQATLHTVFSSLPAEFILETVDRALKADPWSHTLLWHKTMQELRRGNLERARPALMKLDRISGDWPQTKNAHEVFQWVERQVWENETP